MEAIKQTIDNGTIVTLALILLGAIGIIVMVGGMLFAGESIVTDEAFQVASDTSKYSCIVSEVESELLLNCLRVK